MEKKIDTLDIATLLCSLTMAIILLIEPARLYAALFIISNGIWCCSIGIQQIVKILEKPANKE